MESPSRHSGEAGKRSLQDSSQERAPVATYIWSSSVPVAAGAGEVVAVGAADIHDTEIATTGDVMIVDERVETEVGEGIEHGSPVAQNAFGKEAGVALSMPVPLLEIVPRLACCLVFFARLIFSRALL
ncbi:unnamed protein product [Durusdinium trenchii]|uniref:Uncharacterized protein n=2 Tax=Durusdinium trenchii TaxID=1381693 RepID=A0ABP0HES5_9DINO